MIIDSFLSLTGWSWERPGRVRYGESLFLDGGLEKPLWERHQSFVLLHPQDKNSTLIEEGREMCWVQLHRSSLSLRERQSHWADPSPEAHLRPKLDQTNREHFPVPTTIKLASSKGTSSTSTAGQGHECGERSSPRCRCKRRSETEGGADRSKHWQSSFCPDTDDVRGIRGSCTLRVTIATTNPKPYLKVLTPLPPNKRLAQRSRCLQTQISFTCISAVLYKICNSEDNRETSLEYWGRKLLMLNSTTRKIIFQDCRKNTFLYKNRNGK